MKSIPRILLTALMATSTLATAEAAKIIKPTPRPVIETYANWEELRIAKGWPEVNAAVKLSLPKRLLIATAALTTPDRKVRDPNYGFALLLAGPTSRDATRLLAKGVLMNEYAFGDRTPAVLRSLAAEAMRGCKSCVAAYGLIQYAGLDVPQNDVVAYKWYRWAAVVGNAKGIEATALALAEGRGTPKNIPEAKKWANRLEPARRAKLYTEIAKRIVLQQDAGRCRGELGLAAEIDSAQSAGRRQTREAIAQSRLPTIGTGRSDGCHPGGGTGGRSKCAEGDGTGPLEERQAGGGRRGNFDIPDPGGTRQR